MGLKLSKIVLEAKKFATYHHTEINQRRKYSNEPYIIHPAAVAKLVASIGGTQQMIAAAWLHDTVEDTNATLDDIYLNFGPTVHMYVAGLTDVAQKNDGNRALRMAINNEHTASQCANVKTIKLADCYCNVRDILVQDKKFAVTYCQEKRDLLLYLTEGDSTLFTMLLNLLESNP